MLSGNTAGNRTDPIPAPRDFSLGRGKVASRLSCSAANTQAFREPLTLSPSLSLCLLFKSFLPSLLPQEESQSTSFPMNSWFYSLLPSSKTLRSGILSFFYSEINDISLKSFKQSVLNTKLYFGEKMLTTFANIFKLRVGRVSLNAISCFIFFFFWNLCTVPK